MALVKGATGQNAAIGIDTIADTSTLSFTASNGSDKYLLAFVVYQNTLTPGTATYNGTTMTAIGTWGHNDSGAAIGYKFYKLDDNDSGSAYDFVVNWGASDAGTVGMFCASFTGCSDITNASHAAPASSPHSQNITISDQSMIFCYGNGRFGFQSDDAIDIDGTGFSVAGSDFSGSVYLSQLVGHIRDANLSSGTKACEVRSTGDAYNVANLVMEIQEAASTRRIFIV